jgi:putative ABC transport system permease protein
MPYALAGIWHERGRYLPGILAVAFSALLIAMQVGLLLGLFTALSLPVERSGAEVWLGYPGVQSFDLGLPVPAAWEAHLAGQPEVARTEAYVAGVVFWDKPGGGAELCVVIGSRLESDALGAPAGLTPELRARLTEPGAVVVDETALGDLGLRGAGDVAEVAGRRLRVVGTVRGYKGLPGTYVFCSLSTARTLLRLGEDQATYLLARCHDPAAAAAVARRLGARPGMAAFTREEFAHRSQLHWLVKTNAGLALGAAALLGLLVGGAVTSQTLYAAVAASLREYATLEALGIPTGRMAALVLAQSLWVGLTGVGLGLPAALGLAWAGAGLGVQVLLPAWLLAASAALTVLMAVLSGLVALGSLRLVEPATLLR